jgi:hypothetical protein
VKTGESKGGECELEELGSDLVSSAERLTSFVSALRAAATIPVSKRSSRQINEKVKQLTPGWTDL